MHAPLIIGKISYVLGYPFIRLWLWRSHRVYVLIIVDDALLVSKNWLGLHRKWRLPGGGAHKGEDEKVALQREVQEELGIQINVSSAQKLTPQPIRSNKGYSYSVYTVNLAQQPILAVNHAEIVATAWIQHDDLKNITTSCELATALQLLAHH